MKNVIMAVIAAITVAMYQSEQAYAEPGFYYTGDVASAGDNLEHAQAHACLSLTVFLESRSEASYETDMVGMVILNRVASPRFPASVCDVVLQPRQFEPVAANKKVEEVLKAIREGDLFAGYDFVGEFFATRADYKKYLEIESQMYYLMFRQGQDPFWIDALYFYSPSSLSLRGLPTPQWISAKTVVYEGARHVYLQ